LYSGDFEDGSKNPKLILKEILKKDVQINAFNRIEEPPIIALIYNVYYIDFNFKKFILLILILLRGFMIKGLLSTFCFLFLLTFCLFAESVEVKTTADPQNYLNTNHQIIMIKQVRFAGEIQPLVYLEDSSEWLLSEFAYSAWNWNLGDTVSIINENNRYYMLDNDYPYGKMESIVFYTIPENAPDFSVIDWK